MRIGVPDIGVKERIEYLASSFLWRSFAVANISGTSWNVSPRPFRPRRGLEPRHRRAQNCRLCVGTLFRGGYWRIQKELLRFPKSGPFGRLEDHFRVARNSPETQDFELSSTRALNEGIDDFLGRDN